MLPRDVPSWRDNGVWARRHDALIAPTRLTAGRGHDTPSAGSIDSSTAEATAGADRGGDGGTKVVGRKRHKVVGTLGLLLAVVVTAASAGDASAAEALFAQRPPGRYPRLERLWGDSKYHNHDLEAWLRDTYKGPIRIEVTRQTDAEPGFQPVEWRWVVGASGTRDQRVGRAGPADGHGPRGDGGVGGGHGADRYDTADAQPAHRRRAGVPVPA